MFIGYTTNDKHVHDALMNEWHLSREQMERN